MYNLSLYFSLGPISLVWDPEAPLAPQDHAATMDPRDIV